MRAALARAGETIPSPTAFPGGAVYELKWDGYRFVVVRDGESARLWSRQGKDLTDRFPDVAAAAWEQLTPTIDLAGIIRSNAR